MVSVDSMKRVGWKQGQAVEPQRPRLVTHLLPQAPFLNVSHPSGQTPLVKDPVFRHMNIWKCFLQITTIGVTGLTLW